MWRYPPRICQAVSSPYGRGYRVNSCRLGRGAGFLPVREGVSEEHSEGHPKGQFPPHMGGYKDRLCGLFFFVIFLKYILIMIQKLLRTGEKYIICIKKFYGGKIL